MLTDVSTEQELITTLGIDVCWAQSVITPTIQRTPVRRLKWLEALVGVPVWAKLENHQVTGSFKVRGALARLAKLQPNATVIAASAGNHGLGIAAAAARRGLAANVCVPVSASRLKRERILTEGAGLIVHGGTVEESMSHARALAEIKGWNYISPFDDPDVIAGQGTLFLEFLKDCPEIETLIVPIGGGGLISGAVAARSATGHPASIVGCEPEAYASMYESLRNGRISTVLRLPTFADGLAVNLGFDSITFDIVRAGVETIVCLSEEEIAAGTAALLIHESLLVEAAGAASIFALLRLHAEGRIKGAVGLPLCGGNIHHTTLARIMAFPYKDETCLRLLDLRGRRVIDIPSPRVVGANDTAARLQEERSYANDIADMFDEKVREVESVQQQLSAYQNFCKTQGLVVAQESLDLLRSVSSGLSDFITQSKADSRMTASSTIAAELNLRTATQLIAASSTALEWCSPGYSQVIAPQFFDVSAQESGDVNYERYGHSDCLRVEEQILETLGVPPDKYAVTVTSSGMAAYSLIEAFLLRHRMALGDTVLLAPYIYFEATEQIVSLKGVQIAHATSYDSVKIAEQASSVGAKVVFADPLANNMNQRLIDVWDLLSRLNRSGGNTTLVVDGSMLPTAFSTALTDFDPRQVLYYESCSKYLQFGQDMSMAGVVVHAAELKPLMDRLRRNLGAILTRNGARLFPTYKPAQFLTRVRRMEGAAAGVARLLSKSEAVCQRADVIHPSLPSHPDFDLAKKIGRSGGCITFRLHEPGENQRDLLEVLIDHILTSASRSKLPLVKGVSFGFSIPRIAASSAMAETDPPFLRVSVGDNSVAEVEILAQVITNGFDSFSRMKGSIS